MKKQKKNKKKGYYERRLYEDQRNMVKKFTFSNIRFRNLS